MKGLTIAFPPAHTWTAQEYRWRDDEAWLVIMRTVVMKCTSCKKIKELSYFSDSYDTLFPKCIWCEVHKLYVEKYFNSRNIFLIVYGRLIMAQLMEYKFPLKKERKNKKKDYPKEFSFKRKKLLEDARNYKWCTDCGLKELLQVHHIDHNIFNNTDENLSVLCYYCHSKYHKHMQWRKPPKWLN